MSTTESSPTADEQPPVPSDAESQPATDPPATDPPASKLPVPVTQSTTMPATQRPGATRTQRRASTPKRRRRASPAGDADRLGELQEERRFLLRSLADLEAEHDAGDVDERDYHTLRDDYTIRAAEVLRALEASRTTLPPRPPRRWRRTIGVIMVTALVGATMGWLLSRYTGERKAGDTITGGAAALDDTQSLLSQARSLQLSDPGQSIKLFTKIIDREPANVEALTYRGWTAAILASNLAAGSSDRSTFVTLASNDLAKAVAANPNYVDAQCFSAIVKFRLQGDAAAAKPFYDQCAGGSLPSVVGSLVSGLGTDINAALTGTSTPAPVPSAASAAASTSGASIGAAPAAPPAT